MEKQPPKNVSTKIAHWLLIATILTFFAVTAMVFIGLRNHSHGVADSQSSVPKATTAIERELSSRPELEVASEP